MGFVRKFGENAQKSFVHGPYLARGMTLRHFASTIPWCQIQEEREMSETEADVEILQGLVLSPIQDY